MTWVYFLKVKSHKETFQAFQVFMATEKKTSGHVIRCFQCDNRRGEYNKRFFLDLLNMEGISYKLTAPDMQNQNGVSERKIHTIVERARTMLLEASLPECFRADALATAVYILNRSPMEVLTEKTPFEAWFGHQPNLAHLCRFGCDAYLHVPNAQQTKLKPKAHLCRFLGYVPNIGSNIRFNENSFGHRWPEDLKMLEEISEDQTDQLSPPAHSRDPACGRDTPEWCCTSPTNARH